jgi:hypothetical protein
MDPLDHKGFCCHIYIGYGVIDGLAAIRGLAGLIRARGYYRFWRTKDIHIIIKILKKCTGVARARVKCWVREVRGSDARYGFKV